MSSTEKKIEITKSNTPIFESIKFKITFFSIVIGLIPAISLGIFAIRQQTTHIQEKVIENQARILSQKLDTIETFLHEVEIELKQISGRYTLQSLTENALSQAEIKHSENWLKPLQHDFSRLCKLGKRYTRIQLIQANGKEMIHMDFNDGVENILPPGKLKNLADKSYVNQFLELGKNETLMIPSFVQHDVVKTGEFPVPIVRFGAPVFSLDGRRLGILVFTIRATQFLNPLIDIPNGRIMIVDQAGKFLYHSGSSISNKQELRKSKLNFQDDYSSTLFDEILHKKKGFESEIPDEFLTFERISIQSTNKGGYWIGIYSTDRKKVFASISTFRNRFILLILISIIFVSLAARFLCGRITKPLLQLVEIAKSVANGELEIEQVKCNSEDEIGILSRSFDSMVTILKNYILSITKTAKTITGSSGELSTTVREQSTITAQQSTSLTEITTTLEELTMSSSQIAENSSSVVKISATALNYAEKGMESIETIKVKMDQIAEDNKASTYEIVELGKKSKEIGKIMEIINEIADQTKLIAFNAAIEASSAGEAGKRFEVVAVEIRRLADNVMSSIDEIETITEEIQHGINGLVIASENGANRVHEGTMIAAQTLSQLENLVAGAKSTNEASTQISLSTQQQKSATTQVLNALKEIEQGFLEIALSIKQSSSITSQLADSSSALTELVEEYHVVQN